jgi:hypothetical protein
MASATPMIIPRKSQEGIVQYAKSCFQLMQTQNNLRSNMRKIDLAYMREQDLSVTHSRAKNANAYGDKSKFQNITVPVILPQVEAAVTYQSSVFLTGTPIFGVTSSPAHIDAALQMETLIEDQSVRGGWVQQLMMFFRDGFKYNISAVEVNWDTYTTAALDTDLAFSASQAKPREVIWEGNCLKRLDMYNTVWDMRVKPTEVYYKGEFAGYTEIMSRIALKSFMATLPDKMVDNIKAAFESGLGSGGYETYHTPDINPNSVAGNVDSRQGGFNWLSWATLENTIGKIAYKDTYEVTTLYGKILPSDFGLRVPSANTPQIWKFIIVNGQVLIYAERQTNAHGFLPILFGQPLEDGLGYQTKSLAENAQGFQDIASAMWNSVIAARRRAISDRGIYDPSRIDSAQINSDNPSAKIPVRPAAYGKPVNEAYYPIPFRDDQSTTLMQETEQVLRMADKVSGQNPARQGQFVKGNKTQSEFNTVMGNANGRDQQIAMLYEAQLFTPLKEILKYNILQYQGGTSVYNRTTQQEVAIDPVALRKASIEFKLSDGLTPSDKLMDADSWTVAMQMIGSSPQINPAYNFGQLFSYMMKTKGVDLTPFEKSPPQVAYEQAMQQWQQMAMELAKLGQPVPPQPLPEQFGYQPQGVGPSQAATPPPQAQVTNTTQNITRNVSNQNAS